MIIQIDILMYNHFVNISGYCTTKRPTLFFHFQVTLLKFYIKPSDVHRHNAYLDFVFVTVILTFTDIWLFIIRFCLKWTFWLAIKHQALYTNVTLGKVHYMNLITTFTLLIRSVPRNTYRSQVCINKYKFSTLNVSSYQSKEEEKYEHGTSSQ